MNLSGKVALVTGGASGIGKSCVEEFLQNGIKGVVIADINEVLGEKLIEELDKTFANHRAIFVKTNVDDKDSFDNALQSAVRKYNSIDILVNCAGVFDEIDWEKTLRINLFGTSYGCLLAINKYFPNHKSGPKAYIINIASIVGISPASFAPHYTASKHAVIGLTRSYGMNRIVTEAGIYVMAICPGATETPILNNCESRVVYKEIFNEEMRRSFSYHQKPISVAKCVMKALQEAQCGGIWLAQDDASYKINLPTIKTLMNIP